MRLRGGRVWCGGGACWHCVMRRRRIRHGHAQARAVVHSTADCEVGGWLATVAESEAVLEVCPSHAETLVECGTLWQRPGTPAC